MNTHTTSVTKTTKRVKALLLFASLGLVPATVMAQPLSGTKTVCSSGCNYPTLTGTGGLFDAINTNGLGGNLTVTINSDLTEPGDVALNNISVGAANNITIKPVSATLFTISGTSANASTTPLGLVRINGGDNLTINGSFGGSGKYLLFRNASLSSISTVPALAFDNSATNNTVTNCYIESNAQNGGRPPLLISNNGTNGLTVSSCDIRNATAGNTGNPNTAILSNGSDNTVQILNNNIYNFANIGISITNTFDACTVSGNSIYNTLTSFSNGVICMSITSGGGHTISGNYIGGSGPLCTGTWTDGSDASFEGIQCNNTFAPAVSIQGNTIQNINMSNSGGFNGSCLPINLTGSDFNIGTVTGNVVGHTSTANSITVGTEGPLGTVGIRCAATATLNMSNNIVANISTTSTSGGTMKIEGIDISGGGTINLVNNDIHSLTSADNTTTATVTGIYIYSNSTININTTKIYDLAATHASAATVTTGMYLGLGTNNVTQNRIYSLRNSSTNGSIAGINIAGAAGNCDNNQIVITNAPSTNNLAIDGILLSAGVATLYYNSVYIASSVVSGASSTYCYRRKGTAITSIAWDNIFYNGRTGGTGHHCAIGNVTAVPAANWATNYSNYNFLVSADANTIGEWGSGSTMDFATWKTNSLSDNNSWSTDAASVTATNLFTTPSSGNLDIKTSSAEAWYVNGRGTQVAGKTADYGSSAAVRSTTVANGATDIGADEMTPSSTPPAPTVTGTIGVGNTQTFTFAGRTLGTIQWTAGTSLPTAISFTYRPGTTPPNGPSNHYSNGYWTITPTGGTVYTYTLTLYYDPAMLGTAVEANLKMGKKPTTIWSYFSAAVGNTSTKTVSLAGQTSFGDFTLTDNLVPLPVRLTSFTANAKGRNVDIDWKTASEENADMYELERSTNGTDYQNVATMTAKGNNSTYTYNDANAATGTNYYRLRMAETNGDVDYSNTATAVINKTGNTTVAIYPNPAKDVLNVHINTTTTTPVKLEILDLTGRIVYSTNASNGNVAIDLKGLASGNYQLQYGEGGAKEMIRFVKE